MLPCKSISSHKLTTSSTNLESKQESTADSSAEASIFGSLSPALPSGQSDVTEDLRRILTNPSEAKSNEGLDNAEGNLICRVEDRIDSASSGSDLKILDLLGTGTFGQVFKCQISNTTENLALKIVKNKPAYHNQGRIEVQIVKLLNSTFDPRGDKYIVRLLDSFEYKNHMCLSFELLDMSLLDLLTQNQFRGLALSTVQRLMRQILTALSVLQEANIIHCDLKPENILLIPEDERTTGKSEADSKLPLGASSSVKLIDFGSACFEGKTTYSYIQSRFYRAPEVLIGVPYNGAIDLWSLGCVAVEMYLGLPLFPGISQHNQLSRIIEMMGTPPDFMIEEGKNGSKYFTAASSGSSSTGSGSAPANSSIYSSSPGFDMMGKSSSKMYTSGKYRVKTAEEYAVETNSPVPVLKKYLRYNKLDEVILKCPMPNKARLSEEQREVEVRQRQCFLDLIRGLLIINPFERWTAKQAMNHPFIQGSTYHGPYVPTADQKVQERKLAYNVHIYSKQQQHQQAVLAQQPLSGASTIPTGRAEMLRNPVKFAIILYINYCELVVF